MKVWLLYTHNYDFCNIYDTLLNIYDSEEKALRAQKIENKKPEYSNTFHGENTDWTSIIEDKVK